ncbi:MAG: cache domain-containing protein [Desulfobacter sp.]|nr:MAG: cache domain-containing protein [Desulfobacter sp.]
MMRQSLKMPAAKILLFSLILIAAFTGLFDYLSRQYIKVLELQRLDQMRQLVEIARNTIAPVVGEFQAGELGRDQAISRVRNLVRRMTFLEPHGPNYVFMSAYDGTMLVQPFEPEKEMTNYWDFKDPNGVYIIRELVNAARTNREGGFVTYHYMAPGSKVYQEKISFVRGIEELGAYIGTGRYMDDLRREQAAFRWKIIFLEGVLVVLLLLLCLLAIREILLKNRYLKKEVAIRKSSEMELEKRMAELRQLRNYAGSIIDSMPSMLIGVDARGRVTQWNRRAQIVTGLDESVVAGKKLDQVFPAARPHMEKVIQSIQTGQIIPAGKHKRLEQGKDVYEDIIIYPLVSDGMEEAVVRVDDITHKTRMEEIMVQSEKMLSIGGLAAGMAHEINNPLAGMIQSAELMSMRLRNEDIPANQSAAEAAGTSMPAIRSYMEARGIPRMIDAIRASGKRAAKVVENMLGFAGKGRSVSTLEKVDSMIDDTLALAVTDFNLKEKYDFRSIDIRKEYSGELPPVPCDRSKIQQVLLNIFQNAAYAMQTSGVDSPCIILRTALEGDMVCIEIEDNGPGMEKKVCRRVFEPFFTTKPTGIGTGLGLSVSYFIVTETHMGRMEVWSEPGRGTRFSIGLPLFRPADGPDEDR